MECPSCQFQNPKGAKFCNQCGVKLEITCSSCGKINPPASSFCNDCGHDLCKPKEAPAIDYEQPRSYTPKFLAAKILTSRSAIEGERKLVTVLFADVAGFTSMSEKLDPEDVHEIMDGCFRILMDEIHRYEGTVNEFRGDGVMALFGAPIAHEDHAQRACHASLAIQEALVSYSAKLHNEYGVEFKMRIGLNSGPVVVGAIGDDLRMDYTAQGDTANLAARMETNARPGSVLLSEHSYRLTKEFFEFEPLGQIQVKGKEKPVKAYRLTKPSEVETRIAASATKGLTRFVGRRREIETLKEAYEKARSGEGQVVGVVGEAGVGKSRLLLEFRNSLPKGECIYLEGRCLHYGSSMPYLPMLDAFRTYLGIKEGEKESVVKQKMQERIVGSDETLMGCLPPIQELFSVKVDDEGFAKLEPKQKRERTFEAIRDILIRGSQSRPIVWAVEDLHWIDETTEEFLDYMIGWLPGARIMLVLLYRPEYAHQWGSKSFYSKVGVGQLSSGTSADLVEAILEGGKVVPELRELILSRASGNPLFLEEVTHSLLENGSVQKHGNQFILTRTISEIQVPDTIQGIIAARMDRLEESLKRIVQVASVIGREFAFRILQAITEMKEDLKSSLLKLQGLEFIYEKSLFPELEYIFRHALTQEVAYNSLLIKTRKQIHEKIGQAIEELYPDRLEEFYEMLAYHYSKSENHAKAFQFLKASGEKATGNNSTREAFRFFKDALELLARLPETQESKRNYVDLVISMRTVMVKLAYPEGSFEILQKAKNLAEELGNTQALDTMHSFLGSYHGHTGNPRLAENHLQQSFLGIEKMEDVYSAVSDAYSKCLTYMATGEHGKIADLTPRIIVLLENAHKELDSFGQHLNPYTYFHIMYGHAMSAMGNFSIGEQFLKKALSLMNDTNNLYGLGFVEHNSGIMYIYKGDGRGAINHLRKAITCFEKAQAAIYLGQAWALLGYGHYLLGEHESALGFIRKGLNLQTDLDFPLMLSCHYWFLGMVHCDVHNLEQARSCAERGLELSQQNNERYFEAVLRGLFGRILGKMNKLYVKEAEDQIVEGIQTLNELKLRPDYSVGHLYLGELYADASHGEKAVKHLKKAESMFQEMGMDYWLGRTREVLGGL